MKLWLLGVRGSTTASGPDFVRYGGHTSCVAVVPTGTETPTLVLDAGTGLRTLTGLLGRQPYVGCIALTHLHWDHMIGLPFFASGDQDDAEVDVYVPAQRGMSGRDQLAQVMSPPWFPIEPEGLLGRWSFEAIEPGAHRMGGFAVTAGDVLHKGGRTYGYRVEDKAGSFAYLPDHSPALGCLPGVRDLIAGVDVLLHDAQFVTSERAVADNYGHATVQDAVELAADAGVGTLVLIHHSPARTDDQLDAIVGADAPLPVIVAYEGQVLDIPGDLPTGAQR